MNNKQNQSGEKKSYLRAPFISRRPGCIFKCHERVESTPEFDCRDGEIDRVMVGYGRPDCQRQFHCHCELMRSDFCSSERQPLR